MPSTRDRIVVSTNELFRRHGYNGTSLSQISEASGATIGSIYHFFPHGKRQLAAATILESGEAYRQLFELIAGPYDDPAEGIQAMFDGAAEVLEADDFIDPCPIGTVAREVASVDDELRRATDTVFESWVDTAARTLTRGADPGPESVALARTLVAMIEGGFVLARARRDADGLRDAGRHAAELVSLARVNSQAAGVADRVAFQQGDIFEADIDRATVVTLYLFPEANLALRPKLLAELRPGTRVVSNSFHMDDWKPDVHDMSARSSGGILLWIIPARIDGDWMLEIDDTGSAAITVRQRYQEIELEAMGLGATLTVDSAVLEGDRIRFAFGSEDAMYVFDGSVEAHWPSFDSRSDRGGGVAGLHTVFRVHRDRRAIR